MHADERKMSDMQSASSSLTDLSRRASGGDEIALHRVFDAAYHDLRRLARMRLTRSARGVLLDTTSLVHESYLRLQTPRSSISAIASTSCDMRPMSCAQ
jgi:DNA-directed RNA polymerase specialized sigma24 family protein